MSDCPRRHVACHCVEDDASRLLCAERTVELLEKDRDRLKREKANYLDLRARDESGMTLSVGEWVHRTSEAEARAAVLEIYKRCCRRAFDKWIELLEHCLTLLEG